MCLQRGEVETIKSCYEVIGSFLYWQETQIQPQHETPGDTEKRRDDGKKHPPAVRALSEVKAKTDSFSLLISYPEATERSRLTTVLLRPILLPGVGNPLMFFTVQSNLAMQMWSGGKKPNKYFPKEAKARKPPPSLPTPAVTLMWLNETQQQQLSCQPQHTRSVKAQLCASTVHKKTKRQMQTNICLPQPSPPTPAPLLLGCLSACLHLEVVEWHQWRTGSSQHVKSMSASDDGSASFNGLWFCSTWLVDNKEQVAVTKDYQHCLLPILFVSSFLRH